MKELLTAGRLILATILICAVAYPLSLFAFARVAMPYGSEGSLLKDLEGTVVGSERIAQEFQSPGYFWPRPSAVAYNASATGGSNLSPTSPKLAERALPLIERLGGGKEDPVPLDLVTASGSGVDPDISEDSALYQVPRIAAARGIAEAEIRELVLDFARYPGGVPADGGRIVNVLLLNLELDRRPNRS